MMNLAYFCDRGLVREENEDSILVDDLEQLYIVADGMGGHEKGSVASGMVVDSFREIPSIVEEKKLDINAIRALLNKMLNTQVEEVSHKLIAYANRHHITEIMGSTLVGIYKCPNFESWAIFHLGDSRAYHYSNEKLTQLTLDHTDVDSASNVINRAIGNFPAISLDLNYLSTKKGDYFILCSDGVSDYVSNQELLELLLKYRYSLALLCQYLKELIYERGAKDNLSFIVLEIKA